MDLKKLRDLREENELTQTAVAKILGTSHTMYARYERGATPLPIRHLVVLCRLYNVSADYFLIPHRVRAKGERQNEYKGCFRCWR